jgi:23S rRNA (cytidine1920-2'-O)/16S rRNA (cytidine1409-2'-O)-methyltransferase
LQRGAAHVTAVDVGYGVLHERLRADARVEVRERTNVRTLDPSERYDTVVADLSFIGLPVVAPVLVGAASLQLVVLVKPQFEAGRREASKGRGVIRDPAVWRRVLGEVRTAFAESGAAMIGVMRSPLLGADGNVEFLALLRPGEGPVVDDPALDSVVGEDSGTGS